MRTLIHCVLAASVLLVACASQKAAEPAVTQRVKIDSTNVAEAQAAGYKIVNQNGKTLYCSKELQTGSHVRTRTACLTETEWAQARESARATVQDMARRVQAPQGK